MRWKLIHLGIVYNVFSVRVRAFVPLSAPCGVRVRHPLVFSGTHNCTLSCLVCVFLPCGVRVKPLSCSVVPKNCTLSCSVCFFSFFSARVSEQKKRAGLSEVNKPQSLRTVTGGWWAYKYILQHRWRCFEDYFLKK